MSVRIRLILNPYGRGEDVELGEILIYTATTDTHRYVMEVVGTGITLVGELKKTRSCHRNVLHVLRDALNDADLDALGSDYVRVSYET